MRVVYQGPSSDGVDLLDGTHCPVGVPVEVDDALAGSLLEQPTFTAAPAAKAATTPRATARATRARKAAPNKER